MSRILVTGSEGTLGKPLVQELRDRGHEVGCVDLMHTPDPEHMRADVAEYRQIEDAFRAFNPEYVYHLAAEFGRMNGEHYYEQLWRTNVIGTRHVMELALRDGAKLIFASSSEVYGDMYEGSLHEDLTEKNHPVQWNDYAISKWTNERQIAHFQKRNNAAQIMTLRFFNSYGPGEHYSPYRSVVCLFAYRLLKQMEITVYEGYRRSFMYIGDFIPTLANASDRFHAGEIINVGGNEVRGVEEVADICLRLTGASPDLVTKFPKEELNVRDKRAHNYKARNLLGHNPETVIEFGIPPTVKWLRETYDIAPIDQTISVTGAAKAYGP